MDKKNQFNEQQFARLWIRGKKNDADDITVVHPRFLTDPLT